jgi:hypothetical protein
MEAARTSEMSVDNYFTRQYIPEDKSERFDCGSFQHSSWRLYIPPRRWYTPTSHFFFFLFPWCLTALGGPLQTPTSPHGVKLQKSNIDNSTFITLPLS